MDVNELIDVLTVQPEGEGDGIDAFVGHSPASRERNVYGGQFLGQALLAAAATVEPGRLPHSLHAYFVRGGAARTPIHYRVERVRDGRSFSHRSVVATQQGREVFRQLISFQVPTDGLEHREPLAVPPGTDPATFIAYRDWVYELSTDRSHPWFTEPRAADIRFEDPPAPVPRQPFGGVMRLWTRLVEPVPSDDPILHAALLAWLSDQTISDMAMYPHARSWTDAGTNILSLDHALWFYEPARADEWTLFTHEAPATGGGRGLTRGDLVNLSGRRIGALAQEALLVTPDTGA